MKAFALPTLLRIPFIGIRRRAAADDPTPVRPEPKYTSTDPWMDEARATLLWSAAMFRMIGR